MASGQETTLRFCGPAKIERDVREEYPEVYLVHTAAQITGPSNTAYKCVQCAEWSWEADSSTLAGAAKLCGRENQAVHPTRDLGQVVPVSPSLNFCSAYCSEQLLPSAQVHCREQLASVLSSTQCPALHSALD